MAGEVLQVRDRSGRDWCGRIGKASIGQYRFYAAGVVRSVAFWCRSGVVRLGRPGGASIGALRTGLVWQAW